MNKKIIINTIVVGELATNCYIIGSQRTKEGILIDPGAESDKIKNAITTSGLTINLIVLTHGHFDHISAVSDFDLPVYIHKDEMKFLKNAQSNLSLDLTQVSMKYKVKLIPVEHNSEIKSGDILLKVIHTPGHTPGGICLSAPGILISGDTLFKNGIGRTDLPCGSYEKLIESIKKRLLVLPGETKVYPGHGPLTRLQDEAENNMFLCS